MNLPKENETGHGRPLRRMVFPVDDLFQEPVYRRLWLSILSSSFGGQMTSLALPLTAVLVLQATPEQMGVMGACGIVPFVLFSIPFGVWLEKTGKLKVYIAGEIVLALLLASVTLAWATGILSIPMMYGVSFVAGCVAVTSGTVAQIILTQIVPRNRLIEANSRNALANSASEVAGPAIAGVLARMAGAPPVLLVNAMLLAVSVIILRRIDIVEARPESRTGNFMRDMGEGVRFVLGNRLLVSMALMVGAWQVCQTVAMVVQILFATRELGLQDYQLGLCYAGSGIGTIVLSLFVHRLSRRIGAGSCLIAGFVVSGLGWLQLAFLPAGSWSVASFVLMLLGFSAATLLIFTNMLALRQAMTPAPMLARMTGVMRWLTLFPAIPGSLLGGYLGGQLGLRTATAIGGAGAVLVALVAWKWTAISKAPHPGGAAPDIS